MGTIPGGSDITTYDLPYTGDQISTALNTILTTDFENLAERAEGAATQASAAANAASGSANSASAAAATATNGADTATTKAGVATAAATAAAASAVSADADADRAEAAAASLDADRIAYIDGYYATLGAGVADNLAGRGDAVGAEFTFRTAGGEADIGTGRATLKMIRGKSLIFNQMAKAVASGNWSGSNASLSMTAGVGTFTASARGGMAYSVVSPALIVGRKYLVSCLVKLTTASAASNIYVQLQNQSVQLHPTATTSWQRCAAVVEITATASNQMQVRDYRTAGWDAISFAQPQVIDLTAMFGDGNEPTADEFLALYPGYYGANSGELLNMYADSIDTVGFNLLDVNGREAETDNNVIDANHRDWDAATYYVGQGFNNNYAADRVAAYSVAGGVVSVTAATNASSYGVAFPVRVIAGKDYFLQFTQTGSGAVRIYWYGADGLYLAATQASFSSYFAAPATAYWAVIYFTANGNSTASWSGINFNLSWSHWRDGEVEDYWHAVAELPTEDYFPDGMRSAGSVADELTATQAVQRVMAVDLGDLTWTRTAQGDDYIFVSSVVDGMADTSVVLCTKYLYNSAATVENGYIRSGAGDGTLVVRDDAYSTAEAFTAAVVGVVANVELETPVVTDIPGGLAMVYAVDDFGTEEAVAGDISAPLIAEIAYSMNAVDTLRRLPETYISKASFDAFCSALAAQLGVTITASWDDDAGHYTYTIS